ncbi:MAG: O-methyltransferase [Actinomycetota bacterium]|jgi:predicted O-methyltransferase YrrM|nr:O-methyltransferase [Actinomycetota bacterium]
MDDTRWTDVDRFLADTLLPRDPVLEEVLRAAEEGGLPPINVSAPQGMLLHVLARALRAKRVLEIGTLAGYSTIWLARAVGESGRVITLEIDAHHAEVARRNFARAGVEGVVDLRVGPAVDSLAAIEKEGGAPFDLVFIDADKPAYPGYVEWALRLSRPGTLIVVDNVVRGGRILEPGADDPAVAGTREALEMLGDEPRVAATALQTVGVKGYDGFAVALVTGSPT